MVDSLRVRIERGAKLLDERAPGWRSRIDLETLDMRDGACCILGQVYLDYSTGITSLDLWRRPSTRDRGFATAKGERYSDLTAAWCAFLEAKEDK